jgi:hypothetical protein
VSETTTTSSPKQNHDHVNDPNAQLASRLAGGNGNTRDRDPFGHKVVSGALEGESVRQAAASQAAALIAGGTVATLSSWVIAGSTLGPAGTAAAGLVGLVASSVAAWGADTYLDGLFEDAAFKELIRRGLDEQALA